MGRKKRDPELEAHLKALFEAARESQRPPGRAELEILFEFYGVQPPVLPPRQGVLDLKSTGHTAAAAAPPAQGGDPGAVSAKVAGNFRRRVAAHAPSLGHASPSRGRRVQSAAYEARGFALWRDLDGTLYWLNRTTGEVIRG